MLFDSQLCFLPFHHPILSPFSLSPPRAKHVSSRRRRGGCGAEPHDDADDAQADAKLGDAKHVQGASRDAGPTRGATARRGAATDGAGWAVFGGATFSERASARSVLLCWCEVACMYVFDGFCY